MLKDDNVDKPIRDFIRAQKDVEIDRYSDEGCNGEMYFGKRNIFDDRVALKFYSSTSKIESHREPVLLKNISNDNILKVYDARIISEYYSYFLTPEISGGDLQKYIDNNVIDVETALKITVDILNGLTALHSNPNFIVHRDLKPKNILIDAATKRAIISDFGSVKVLDVEVGSVTGSKSTHIYRPKEVIAANKYTFQSDIYQVGMILFQALGGWFPDIAADWLTEKQKKKLHGIKGQFDQSEYIDSVWEKRILANKLLDLDSLPKYISQKMKTIIRRATDCDLSKRYKTTSEFLNDIYRVQSKLVNYWTDNDVTFAESSTKKCKFYQDKKGEWVLECLGKDGKTWRKQNNHDGTYESIVKRIENGN